MPEIYNVYCDESCHLEHSECSAMVIGAVYCKKSEYKVFVDGISEIKRKYNIPIKREIKWTKVSPALIDYYKDIVDFFFSSKGLFFRGLVVPDKSILDHQSRKQTHEEWYWKMYYEMLKTIFHRNVTYNIFIDIKDTNSTKRCNKLRDILQHTRSEFDGNTVNNVQIVRSHEVALMQLTDIFIGALAFVNRKDYLLKESSSAKMNLISRIKERTGLTLEKTTYLSERKFNVFIWEPTK